jgi:exopolysaccharide production protein ExoY
MARIFDVGESAPAVLGLRRNASEKSESPVGGRKKRTLDVVVALVALIGLAPLFLMIALLIKLTDGGTVFYGHQRVGQGGRGFRCLKFRSMAMDSDGVLADYLRDDELARAEWSSTRKLKVDPRVTLVGAVLRRMSLDELPQLWNVLRGDMSLVGPRPVVESELELYGECAKYYLMARPGITGPWQVSGRNDISYQTRVMLDRAYVVNWSMAEDWAIIFRTVPAVLAARGSY